MEFSIHDIINSNFASRTKEEGTSFQSTVSYRAACLIFWASEDGEFPVHTIVHKEMSLLSELKEGECFKFTIS